MDNKIPENKIPNSETTEKKNESTPQRWDALWQRVVSQSAREIFTRVGTLLASLALIVLVVWVLNAYFSSSRAITTAAGGANQEVSAGIALPGYAGVAPVSGLARGADTHTDQPSASRYEISEYVVVTGDYIFGIADRFGLKPESVIWANYDILLDNPASLKPGQKLRIPPTDGVLYTWHENDGLNKVSETFKVKPEDIISWPGNQLNAETIGDYAKPNIEVGKLLFVPGGRREYVDWFSTRIRRDNPAVASLWGPGKCSPVTSGPTGSGSFIWPTTETYISGYEYTPEVNHWGIDIGGDLGNPIYAMDAGVVVYAGWNDWGYGNVVVIDHGNSWQTLYAHLSKLYVECGSFVYQGDVIAEMGSTGNSSGPHLHLEMMSDIYGRPNPHRYLPY